MKTSNPFRILALSVLGGCSWGGDTDDPVNATSNALSAEWSISVNAFGSPAAGVQAHFTVSLDGVNIGQASATSSLNRYSFNASTSPNASHNVIVTFDNDAFISGEDRNLYVESLEVNGKKLVVLGSSSVVYDRGPLDGEDIVPTSNGTMPWTGSLVFSLPASYFPDSTAGCSEPTPTPTGGSTEPPPPPPPPPAGDCETLTNSGPVVASQDGQVIENLRITSPDGPAIRVEGFSDVIIRNVQIMYSNGSGIYVENGLRTRIENIELTFTGAPPTGGVSYEANGISLYNSHDSTVTRVKTTMASEAVYLDHSERVQISLLEAHDPRGIVPFAYRGGIVQFVYAHNSSLTDFSLEVDLNTSWTGDTLNSWRTTGATVKRGLIDGNNDPVGLGMIADSGSTDFQAEDVDIIHTGNGCFGAATGELPVTNSTFKNIRCRDTHCDAYQGRYFDNNGQHVPVSSDGLIAVAWPPNLIEGMQVLNSVYFNHCNPGYVVDAASRMSPLELTEQDFTPRAPLRLNQCWK